MREGGAKFIFSGGGTKQMVRGILGIVLATMDFLVGVEGDRGGEAPSFVIVKKFLKKFL